MQSKLFNKSMNLEGSFFLSSNSRKTKESGMCDVIKIRIKRRNAMRNGKGNQPLNIKTSVKRPISS